jgi:hypothetical protein
MSIEKAELKILIATDIGASIEDSLEAAKKDMYRQEGAVTSFGQAAKACEMLCEVVNKDLDEGRVASMELAEAIKLWLTRAANAQRNLARNAENGGMSAGGKVTALEGAIALIAKYRQVEQLKIAQARVAVPAPQSGEASVHAARFPGMPIKERRLAEERLAQAPEPVIDPPEPDPPAAVTILPPAKRKGRPPSKGK